MSSIEVVDVAQEDVPTFFATSLSFWGEAVDDDLAGAVDVLQRPLLARLDGEDAGTAGVIEFRLTLPGGAEVAMDGVTWVVVSAAARRRGVLRAMMEHMLEGARERGVPLLGLGASESMIYRRFGYGTASHIGLAEIDTVHAALRVPVADPGTVRMHTLDGAAEMWEDVESRQLGRVGHLNRPGASWRRVLATAAKPRDGMSPLQVAVHRGADGVTDGFINYRTEQRWPAEIADGVVHVQHLAALNRDAHVALWQHVLSMDLMEHLRMERYWLDDPIQHLLLDGRRMRVNPRDDLHLRVADVAAALSARRYGREDSVVIEVRDPPAADIAGRYLVEGGLDHAAVSRTSAAADIVLGAPSLGSLVLGDVSVSALHGAGLVEEARPGAVRRASAMFAWAPRPWLTYMF